MYLNHHIRRTHKSKSITCCFNKMIVRWVYRGVLEPLIYIRVTEQIHSYIGLSYFWIRIEICILLTCFVLSFRLPINDILLRWQITININNTTIHINYISIITNNRTWRVCSNDLILCRVRKWRSENHCAFDINSSIRVTNYVRGIKIVRLVLGVLDFIGLRISPTYICYLLRHL